MTVKSERHLHFDHHPEDEKFKVPESRVHHSRENYHPTDIQVDYIRQIFRLYGPLSSAEKAIDTFMQQNPNVDIYDLVSTLKGAYRSPTRRRVLRQQAGFNILIRERIYRAMLAAIKYLPDEHKN